MYDENQVKQLVSRGIWVFGMVLVGCGSNDKRLRVWEGELGGLLFQLQTPSSEATTCRRERLKQCWSSRDSPAT